MSAILKSSWLTAANGLTALRFVLIFPTVLAIRNGNILVAISLLTTAAASDAADGVVARRTGTSSARGALLDVAADTTLVLSVQVHLSLTRTWPPYLLGLSVCSILTFLLVSAESRRVSKNTVGRYTGAVLMGALILHLVLIMVRPASWRTAVRIVSPAIGVYLTLSVLENLLRPLHRLREQS